MNTKALRRQLLAAIAMLLVATVALGSSTYAWFAQNTKVTAERMTVKAESSSPFIQIKSDADDEYSTATTTLKTLAEGKELKLVAPTSISDKTVAWGTTFSTNPNEVQASNTVSAVSSENLENYVLSDSVTIKNASKDVTANELRISTVKFTAGDTDTMAPATRILLVWADGYAMYNEAGTLIGGQNTIAGTFAGEATVAIDIYMYFDGTDSTAYTAGAANLANVSAELAFTIKGDVAHASAATATYTFPTVA